MDLQKKITELKKERNALILAHNYQNEAIQDIADFIGDSYELSEKATNSNADIIVFCGVHFMAETANILSPEKTVLLPEITAGCPMADTVTKEDVEKLKEKYPEAAVVCYVNSSAEVKAESDACCTSSNAVKVVESLPQEKIIFVPDKNLASYVQKHTKKEIIPWEGCCKFHDQVTVEDIKAAREKYPDVPILVHPECSEEVVNEADFVGSTSNIIRFVKRSDFKSFVIGTEIGILYPLQKENPEKTFYPLSDKLYCPDMKKITLEKVYESLKNNEPKVEVSKEIASKALRAVNRMISATRRCQVC